MKNVQVTQKSAQQRCLPPDEKVLDYGGKIITLKLMFSPEVAYRVYDEFEEFQIDKGNDGSLMVTASYPEDDWVWSHLLSYGDNVKVLEPERARIIIKERLSKALEDYL